MSAKKEIDYYNKAVEDAIAIVQKDLDEALQYSASNTFASGHLKALIPKLKQLIKNE